MSASASTSEVFAAAEIRQLDAEDAEIDRRRKGVYNEARDFGFNTAAIKQIARQKHPGQAKAQADDLIAYLTILSGKEAAGRLKREPIGEIAFDLMAVRDGR